MAGLTGTDFRPAKPWGWLIALAALLNRVVIVRHTKLDVRPDDLALLRSLPPGCLIAPNHAHHADPQVTFALARRAGRRVIFMATREAFDICKGWWGWCLQRLGAFSVNRGAPNAEALNFAPGDPDGRRARYPHIPRGRGLPAERRGHAPEAGRGPPRPRSRRRTRAAGPASAGLHRARRHQVPVPR